MRTFYIYVALILGTSLFVTLLVKAMKSSDVPPQLAHDSFRVGPRYCVSFEESGLRCILCGDAMSCEEKP